MLALARDELLDRRYRVVRWIGQGACAVVYEATDTHQGDRSVAIKILNTELITSPNLQARFLQEAEASMHIDSPFVVTVHAVGTLDDGHPYIVMELLDGEDLGRLIDRIGALEEHRAVELAIHALSGLAHAHSRKILHRDIKPANLVIVRSDSGDEVLKIVDLGISKLVTDPGDAPSELVLTRTNVVLGSPVYMSPEQARGAKHMDHRSDVYSVGVVLYECLTGSVPHDGDNFNDLMFKIALEDAPDPRLKKPKLDPDLVAIVQKALARDLDKRFASASLFREALLEWGAAHGARVPPAPSSSRMRSGAGGLTPRSRVHSRPLEITLGDDSIIPPAPPAAPAAAKPLPPRLADALEQPEEIAQDRSRTRTKFGIVLGIVAALGVVVLLLVRSTGTTAAMKAAAASSSSAAPIASVVTPVPEPIATVSASASPSASAAKPSAAMLAGAAAKKPARKSIPRKVSGATLDGGNANANGSDPQPEGDDTDESTPAPED